MERGKWVEGEEEEEFDPNPSQVGLGGEGIFCPPGRRLGWMVGGPFPTQTCLREKREKLQPEANRMCALALSAVVLSGRRVSSSPMGPTEGEERRRGSSSHE